MIYHLKDVCEMCGRSLNHFSWINIVPCGVFIDVNVSFDTWIAWQRQMYGWLFLWQNVRVVNRSITHDYLIPSLSFNVSMSSGNSNLKLGNRDVQFRASFSPVWWYHCTSLRFLQNMILRKNLLINFNIITRNYCLNKTTLIFCCSVSFVRQYRFRHKEIFR